MSMTITVTENGVVPLVTIAGRIKGEGDEKLQKVLKEVVEKQRATIIVDISGAEYIDSHGLGILIYFHKTMQGEKRRLVLLNTNTDPECYMSRLVEITNLDKVMNIVTSMKDV